MNSPTSDSNNAQSSFLARHSYVVILLPFILIGFGVLAIVIAQKQDRREQGQKQEAQLPNQDPVEGRVSLIINGSDGIKADAEAKPLRSSREVEAYLKVQLQSERNKSSVDQISSAVTLRVDRNAECGSLLAAVQGWAGSGCKQLRIESLDRAELFERGHTFHGGRKEHLEIRIRAYSSHGSIDQLTFRFKMFEPEVLEFGKEMAALDACLRRVVSFEASTEKVIITIECGEKLYYSELALLISHCREHGMKNVCFQAIDPKNTSRAQDWLPAAAKDIGGVELIEPEKELDLTNPDIGLDDELAEAIEEEMKLDKPNPSPGISRVPAQNEFPKIPRAASHKGKGQLLVTSGGNTETETAVARSLEWLARQQTKEGFWEFDGTHKADRVAATSMCLLPFLAAGETHVSPTKYKPVVAKGITYLKSAQKVDGMFNADMYSQAIATMAICEAYGMTEDAGLKKYAVAAVDYIVKAQAPRGNWGYKAGVDGDTSIVGWQIQALQSARLAGLAVPGKTFGRAEWYLVRVSDDSESRYGYRSKGSTPNMSAVGLLSRIYIGGTARKPWVERGVSNLWNENKPAEDKWDVEYYYHATEVFRHYDGKDWHQKWNPAMRKILLDKQVNKETPGAKPDDVGSFPIDTGLIGKSCGKLGTTALACLTLEVYYRYLPLNKPNPNELMEMNDK